MATTANEFHLDLDTIPECVRDQVLCGVGRIRDAITSAPIVGSVMYHCASAGVSTISVTPRDGGLIGAWASLSIKDPAELVALRRLLAKDGWAYESKSDYPEDRRFVILLKRGERESIGLNVYLGSDGARCQYVEVGKKTVPVYELKCEGGAP